MDKSLAVFQYVQPVNLYKNLTSVIIYSPLWHYKIQKLIQSDSHINILYIGYIHVMILKDLNHPQVIVLLLYFMVL